MADSEETVLEEDTTETAGGGGAQVQEEQQGQAQQEYHSTPQAYLFKDCSITASLYFPSFASFPAFLCLVTSGPDLANSSERGDIGEITVKV